MWKASITLVSSAAEFMKYISCHPTAFINSLSRKSKKTGGVLAVMLISQESCVNLLTYMPQFPCLCSENIFSVTGMLRGCYCTRPIALCESLSNTESCSLALNSLKKGIWLQLKNAIQNMTTGKIPSSSQISGATLGFC